MTQVCVEEGCPFAENGGCKIGSNPPKDCPNLDDDGAETIVEQQDRFLMLGDDLDADDAWSLHLANGSEIVAVLGDANAGKTTLVAELFRRFQEYRGAEFHSPRFIASQTLIGFYSRLHESMLSSGREVPNTIRTPLDQDRFLHLHLGYTDETHHILLQDISGERWRHVRQNGSLWKNAGVIAAHPDRVLLVLDGSAITKPGEAQAKLKDLVNTVRAAKENQLWKRDPKFALVVTKADRVRAAGRVGQDLHSQTVERAQKRLEKLVGEIEVIQTECRGDDSETKIQQSLQPVFEFLRPEREAIVPSADPWGA